MLDRDSLWSRLESTSFDIIVIGGGITGAGIARDAALRGLKVALFEKNDFAWGTSSRSSKLVHGGFRYLEHYEFGLVMESLRERLTLMRIAPHIVHPLPFYIPVYKGEKPPSILLRIGLIAYEYLSFGKRVGGRKWLSPKKAITIFPFIRKEGLKGVGQYFDCNMNDARLCLENIISAVELGATCLNYSEVVGFLKDQGKITGVQVKNQESGKIIDVHAKIVVNACGPWSDMIKSLDDSSAKKRLSNAKGVHVITKRIIEDDKALAIPLKDGRIIFVLPFKNKYTLVGTTDTFYDGDVENVICEPEEAQYLLDGYNMFFPDNPIEKSDIISSYAGVRPLVFDEKHGASSSDVSREHKIFTDQSGLITIVGGKYTTYRRMGKRITDLVVKELKKHKQLPKDISKCMTDKIPLPGGRIPNKKNWLNFESVQIQELVNSYAIDSATASHIVRTYGSNAEHVVNLSQDKGLLEKILPDQPYILGEVYYSIHNEYCRTLLDYYWLRTFLALETDFSSSIDKIADIFVKELKWSIVRVEYEKKIVIERLKQAQFIV
jgi:glycerol-3-phosphate dehydrogenase